MMVFSVILLYTESAPSSGLNQCAEQVKAGDATWRMWLEQDDAIFDLTSTSLQTLLWSSGNLQLITATLIFSLA